MFTAEYLKLLNYSLGMTMLGIVLLIGCDVITLVATFPDLTALFINLNRFSTQIISHGLFNVEVDDIGDIADIWHSMISYDTSKLFAIPPL